VVEGVVAVWTDRTLEVETAEDKPQRVEVGEKVLEHTLEEQGEVGKEVDKVVEQEHLAECHSCCQTRHY